MKHYFITGIGTGIGKTLVASILVEALKADYWKPVQAGELHNTDSQKVQSLITNKQSRIHPETFRLRNAISPHAAAPMDGVHIQVQDFRLPETTNTLIIESAGGVMVPLNDKELTVDLIQHLQSEVILVSMNYLGSINHTLLTVDLLKTRKVPVRGIIFTDDANHPSCEETILSYTGLPCLGRIPRLKEINREAVLEQAKQFGGDTVGIQ